MLIFPRSSLLLQALVTAPTKGKTILQHQHTGATAASVIRKREGEEKGRLLVQKLDALEKNPKYQGEEEEVEEAKEAKEEDAMMLMLVKASGEEEAFVSFSIMKKGIKLPLVVSLFVSFSYVPLTRLRSGQLR